jgi:S-adenosylhomocysteine hydrolase
MSDQNVLTLHSLTPTVNRKAIGFFNAVSWEVTGGVSLRDKVQVIVVIHAYEHVLPFIQSLDKVVAVSGIIFKNSTGTLRPEYADCLRKAGYRVLNIKKADFIGKDSETTIQKILDCLDPGKETIIMDHGGYFAFKQGALLARDEFPPEKVIAITEYAANGEERWKKIPDMDRPVISIGRSQIKEASDMGSAESIVYSAISFCQNHNIPLAMNTTKIGVIGSGRLGSGITDMFLRNHIRVSVYDSNELKMSGIRHADAVSKEQLLKECDVIFCATGNRAISPQDFKIIKDHVVLFTVTSPDDEINLKGLIDKKILIPQGVLGVKGEAHIYGVAGTEKKLVLPHNGESPNIVYSSSVNDPTIFQPYALHLAATIKGFQHRTNYRKGVQHVEERYENTVARIWNQHYNPNRGLAPPMPE